MIVLMLKPHTHLYTYVDELQMHGKHYFLRDEAINSLSLTKTAFSKSASRLVAKKRLFSPSRGFYVIVPLEYQKAGAPPASWYLDTLMKYHEQPYYIGLLSAAALHGSAHQQPQEFQVMTNKSLRPIQSERELVRFFTKKQLNKTPTVSIQVPTGHVLVSTPAATTIDLVQYASSAGYFNNVATAIAGLIESIAPHNLLKTIIEMNINISTAQRLGVICDELKAEHLAEPLKKWVDEQIPNFILFRTDLPDAEINKNIRWKVLMNDKIEVDE